VSSGTSFASARRHGAPNDSTRKRLASSPSGQRFDSKPAFATRWRTNARASGRWRQTLGRNRARWPPAERMSPSQSGSSPARSSDSLAAGIGRGRERIDTSRRSPVSSDSLRGGKRGSAKAARAWHIRNQAVQRVWISRIEDPSDLRGRIIAKKRSARAADTECYSAITSPEPPNSLGKSLSFGSPSLIGRTVS
jgi:hypothetical protein